MPYVVSRENSIIALNKDGQRILSIFVDATDNRLTIRDLRSPMEPDINEGITRLSTFLAEHFGGKQIFILPDELKVHFQACGFSLDPTAHPASARLRVTTFANLSQIIYDRAKDAQLSTVDPVVLKTDNSENRAHIEALMKNSKFLVSKIAQYEMQGYEGFQLICEYSQPIALANQGRIVAFCRVTHLNGNDYYLGDTFVDETDFSSKAEGTAILYHRVSLLHPSGRILVIAPPDRVQEFEEAYGCEVVRGRDIMTKFALPGPDMTLVFEEEKERLLQNTLVRSFQPS
jgi:hypothetical protein